MKNHEEIEVTLRNYKKDGTLFHNHLKVTPLLDNKGRVLYYLGVQYDVSPIKLMQKMKLTDYPIC